MTKEFTIPIENMPTRTFSLTLKEPLFKDRREVSRRYPGQQSGYSMEELLLSTSITAINNNQIPSIPRDPIQNYKDMPLLDAQYALAVFLSMFTLDQELSDAAKEIGTTFKNTYAPQYIVEREDMPLKEFSFTFRPPLAYDRIQIDRQYAGANSNCGYSLEEMIFADCITAIDGNPILSKPKEVITLIDNWTHLDAQFAIAIFLNTVSIDDSDSKAAKSLGKSLRTGLSNSVKVNSDSKKKNTQVIV